MLNPGEVLVWRVRLDETPAAVLPPLLAEQAERAARFTSDEVRLRYIRSHAILRAILGGLGLPDEYRSDERGKPYLPGLPDIHFSLSRSHSMALYAVADGVAVGADIERIRPLPEYEQIAERFLPASAHLALLEAPEATREHEFFRAWTRQEAALKALGIGLYGAGTERTGEWTFEDVDAGAGFAAAVAARDAGWRVRVRDF